jgi:hypothetical protein
MFCAEKQAQNFIDHTAVLFAEHPPRESECSYIVNN